MEQTGTLSVVATPIGNLEDITLRALRILKEADYVLCEDTRVTKKLLTHYSITTVTKRYDAHASEETHKRILADLQNGLHVALVSDAGTPGVSDPGVLLTRQAREQGVRIEAIPGPSSVTAAFSLAGLAGNRFSFLGFIPQKKGRQTFFETIGTYEHPVIFFESTHRIMKTLAALRETNAHMHVTICRELTKLHEEVVSGSPAEIETYFTEYTDHQKGEFVIIVSLEGGV